jgi:hypothetical protein
MGMAEAHTIENAIRRMEMKERRIFVFAGPACQELYRDWVFNSTIDSRYVYDGA